MVRVLQLVTDLEPGGTPLRLARLAVRLRALGVDVVLGCLAPPGPLSESLHRAAVPTFACDARHRFDVGALRRLAAHVRRIDPDLVHATLFHANVAARLVGRIDRARPIVTGSATIEVERALHRFGERLTAGLSDWHLVNGAAVAAHVIDELGFSPARVVVVPNGVDCDAIAAAPAIDRAAFGIRADLPLVVWVGRMDVVKRVPLMMGVLDRAQAAAPHSLALIGDGAGRGAIEAARARLAWRERVHLVGWRNDVQGWLKSAELLALSSLTEGSSNALLEAQAAGCCVVASDIAACRDSVEDQRTGVLLDWCNRRTAADAIARLLLEPKRRAAMAENARVAVRRRNALDMVAAQLSGVYGAIVTGGECVPRGALA